MLLTDGRALAGVVELAAGGEHQGELLASAKTSNLIVHSKVHLGSLQAGGALTFVDNAGPNQFNALPCQLDWQLSSSDKGTTDG